jgi:hypothetical protein
MSRKKKKKKKMCVLFADDLKKYRSINNVHECKLLQSGSVQNGVLNMA